MLDALLAFAALGQLVICFVIIQSSTTLLTQHFWCASGVNAQAAVLKAQSVCVVGGMCGQCLAACAACCGTGTPSSGALVDGTDVAAVHDPTYQRLVVVFNAAPTPQAS
jgi:hypothetical protein